MSHSEHMVQILGSQFPASVFVAGTSVGHVAHGGLGAARRNTAQDEMAGRNGGLVGLRSKRTRPPLGGIGSGRLLVLCRIVPPVTAGKTIGTAGRRFGVVKALPARLFSGRTDWFYAFGSFCI